MEEEKSSRVVNHFEAGSNCQVFNGPISGCVFAMPGATVNQSPVQQVAVPESEGKKENSSDDDVLNLLDELVKDAINNRNTPKYILLPVRAAKDAGVLPCVDLKWVNERYKLKLNPMNWSTWVNKEDVGYDGRELLPLVSRFQALKTPK